MTNCELDYNRRVLLNQAGFQKTTQNVIDFVNLSPTHIEIMTASDRTLRSLGQTGKDQRVASKAAGNGSCRTVAQHPKNGPIFVS